MLPVYMQLPKKFRGDFHIGEYVDNPKGLTVVASTGDYQKTEGPVIFFEHGAGFTYNVNHKAYAGGPGKERVVLFCSPNRYAADANTATYPDTPQVIVGCPKLDRYAEQKFIMPDHPTVAFSFHWDSQVAPETRSAWPHFNRYFSNINNLSRRRSLKWDMIGHGHPRYFDYLKKQWLRYNIPAVQHFNDVINLADIYVCDNSSTLYEWAALGRPVIVLNAPWYRRDVQQGLRFWDLIPGVQVDEPVFIDDAIRSVIDKDTFKDKRKEITEIVYPNLWCAADKAAEAIVQYLS